jgi:ribonuclease BN (tRNA processing enzyme)
VKLVLLGTGTLVPEPNRASAGIAVVHEEQVYLFDVGRGVLGRMAEAGLRPLELEYLHLSHLHPDHTCDLVPMLFAMNYGAKPERAKTLHVTTPEGFHNFFDHLRRAWRWVEPRFPFHVREAEEGEFSEGPALLQTLFLEHGTMANLGYRIEIAGKTVAYTGDTGPADRLLSLARGVDILVAECSFSDAKAEAAHLSPTRLGQIASAAECKSLVITHLYPETDPDDVERSVKRSYAGEVVLARDGMEIEV